MSNATRRRTQRNTGFTLIEFILYVALASMVIGTASYAASGVIRQTQDVAAAADVIHARRVIEETLSYVLDESTDIAVPVAGESVGELVLVRGGDPQTTVRFYEDAGTLYRQDAADPPVAVTPASVTVSDVRFRRESVRVRAVRVDMTVKAALGGVSYRERVHEIIYSP